LAWEQSQCSPNLFSRWGTGGPEGPAKRKTEKTGAQAKKRVFLGPGPREQTKKRRETGTLGGRGKPGGRGKGGAAAKETRGRGPSPRTFWGFGPPPAGGGRTNYFFSVDRVFHGKFAFASVFTGKIFFHAFSRPVHRAEGGISTKLVVFFFFFFRGGGWAKQRMCWFTKNLLRKKKKFEKAVFGKPPTAGGGNPFLDQTQGSIFQFLIGVTYAHVPVSKRHFFLQIRFTRGQPFVGGFVLRGRAYLCRRATKGNFFLAHTQTNFVLFFFSWKGDKKLFFVFVLNRFGTVYTYPH